MFIAVGIAVDHAFYSLAFGVLPVAPVKIQSVRIGVELNPCAGLSTGINHSHLVKFLWGALQQQAPG